LATNTERMGLYSTWKGGLAFRDRAFECQLETHLAGIAILEEEVEPGAGLRLAQRPIGGLCGRNEHADPAKNSNLSRKQVITI